VNSARTRQLGLAFQWTAATATALTVTHVAIEIAGAALFGYTLIFLLPFIGAPLGGLAVALCQWLILRRRFLESDSWIGFTVVGFFATGLAALLLAMVLFVPSWGLSAWRAFLSCAVPTPLIGLCQSLALRRWSSKRTLWIMASTAGWTAFVAVHIFDGHALPAIDRLAGRLVSTIAGYDVASAAGATVAGGMLAGAITGLALAVALRDAGGSQRSDVLQPSV